MDDITSFGFNASEFTKIEIANSLLGGVLVEDIFIFCFYVMSLIESYLRMRLE